MKHLLSFLPYILSFAVVYAFVGVRLLKIRHLKELEKEKAELLNPAFGIALTLCIVVCACKCIYYGHLALADRVFVFIWAVWSVFAHRDLKVNKK